MEQYIAIDEMKTKIETRFDAHLYEILGIYRSSVLKENAVSRKTINEGREKASKGVIDWEHQISKYKNELSEILSLELIEGYEKRELKELLAENLWTISSALKTTNDELKRYREMFYKIAPQKIYSSVKAILKSADDYYLDIFPNINLHTLTCPDDFRLNLPEETMLGGVIGLGIRSEILHRLYPGAFPIMTRKSVWGMFFFAFKNTEESEFIKDENGRGANAGKSRTVNNWEYDYLRFLFYNNFIANMLEQAFRENNMKFSEKYRFGYVNMFLSDISKKNKKHIDSLSKWKYAGGN